ncbi:MAG TPA: cytochrome P450 [Chloroflexia bacterium]|nr:cytochrome P450 [Chloroflexia bacterium]
MARQCPTQPFSVRGEPTLRVAHSSQAPTQTRPALQSTEPTRRNSSSQLPGPRLSPMLGWWPNVLPMLRDPAISMLHLWYRYGDAVSLGNYRDAPILIVFSPEYNRYVLTNNDIFYSLDVNSGDALFKVPPDTSAARLLSGIASMNGEEHTAHRRLLMPSFHKKRVDALRDSMVECVENHIAGWRDGDPRILVNEMLDLTLAVAIVGLIGLNPAEEGKRVRNLIEQWSQRGLTPQVALLPYDLPGTPYRRFRVLSEQVEAELIEVIKRKRTRVGSADDGNEGDALALLIHAQDEDGTLLSDSDLIGHLSTLFTAGHETTASALTWTLFLLTQHPHILADLVDELDGVLHGDAPSLEQLHNLPLLDNIVNEGLRMFPPGMWIFRTAVKPFELGPYSQPAFSQLIFSPTVTHYRPDLYPNPHTFDPHRWETINPTPYEYLPFGGGPRRCLGATFALLEIKLALSIILQRWRIEVPHRHRVDRSGTILSRPKDGPPITIHKQDRHFVHSAVRGNIHDLVDFGPTYK